MKKKQIIALLLILSFCGIKAQTNNSLERNLNMYMNTVRSEVYSISPNKDLYNNENAQELIQLLDVFYIDTVIRVRAKAYYLTYKAASNIDDLNLKQNAVFKLILALRDQDSGNVGNVVNFLTNFSKDDFNESSKDSLRSILHNQKAYLGEIIKLVGFVGLKDKTEYLQSIIFKKTYNSNKIIWAAHIALARMDVQDEINFCVNLVKQQTLNDEVVYELLPDLIYIRDKQAINYLIEILYDETKNCFSSNPENSQQIICAYRVMEYLAPVIKNFPLMVDDSGDLIVDDYQEALKITRNWFNERSEDYFIVNTTY